METPIMTHDNNVLAIQVLRRRGIDYQRLLPENRAVDNDGNYRTKNFSLLGIYNINARPKKKSYHFGMRNVRGSMDDARTYTYNVSPQRRYEETEKNLLESPLSRNVAKKLSTAQKDRSQT